MRTARFLAGYALAWVPFWALYALGVASTDSARTIDAILAATSTTIVAAVFGLPVWWLAPRIAWREGRRYRAVLVHFGAAVLYSGACLAVVSLEIYLYARPSPSARLFITSGSFFQALNGLALYGFIAGISSWSAAVRAANAERELAARSEALRMEAELRALRAQLNPHFLFNTLHTITSLVRTDQGRAETALHQLASLLRYVLAAQGERGDQVLLETEVRFVRSYLELERLRFGDRLRVEWNVSDDALECAVLSFTLQTLVENAVKHGVAPRAQGGTIRIEASTHGDRLSIAVGDDGPGSAQPLREGVGLGATRRRLEARFGHAATLRITTAPREGFETRVEMPAIVSTAPQLV
ncbi:MAG TPA: histidine kinase [Gemmatimonadaceae bacterium]|nr:histidine kinase [Gemmatimonadaceae bacterium]